jgi:hypothetical protein
MNISNGSQFCNYCSRPIVTPHAAPAIQYLGVQWEYADYEFHWSHGQIAINVGRSGWTVPAARLEIWQEYQRGILSELQNWLNAGWEPVGEVGPSSIEVRTYKAIHTSFFGWIWIIFWSICTWGLFLLFVRDFYAEPIVFRVQMRRAIRR